MKGCLKVTRFTIPRQMMIGVYNHLRNERYLGSITILKGDWIPRDSTSIAKLIWDLGRFSTLFVSENPSKAWRHFEFRSFNIHKFALDFAGFVGGLENLTWGKVSHDFRGVKTHKKQLQKYRSCAWFDRFLFPKTAPKNSGVPLNPHCITVF